RRVLHLALRAEHPSMTDWVDVLQEGTRLCNAKQHSTTRLVPDHHFSTHNHMSRLKTPILGNESVTLTVAQVTSMEKLRWLTPVDVQDDTAEREEVVLSTAHRNDHRAPLPCVLCKWELNFDDRIA